MSAIRPNAASPLSAARRAQARHITISIAAYPNAKVGVATSSATLANTPIAAGHEDVLAPATGLRSESRRPAGSNVAARRLMRAACLVGSWSQR